MKPSILKLVEILSEVCGIVAKKSPSVLVVDYLFKLLGAHIDRSAHRWTRAQIAGFWQDLERAMVVIAATIYELDGSCRVIATTGGNIGGPRREFRFPLTHGPPDSCRYFYHKDGAEGEIIMPLVCIDLLRLLAKLPHGILAVCEGPGCSAPVVRHPQNKKYCSKKCRDKSWNDIGRKKNRSQADLPAHTGESLPPAGGTSLS